MEKILTLHRGLGRYDTVITDWAGSVLSLAIRWYVGWQFFKSGLIKISDWGATLALFRDEYQVPLLPPEVAAVAGAGGELLFPALLAIGFFSRPAALGLFAVNLTAVISYPQLFQFECPAGLRDHFYWGALLLVSAVFGPGKFSLDHWIAARGRG
jgi:putative oxidoreductase